MNQDYIIAVDFDGTLVEHRFPEIGPRIDSAFLWLHRFVGHGNAKLILWTMRCCEGSMGDVLTPAIEYCRARGIEFWGINENPQQKQSRWSTSGKVYAHCYIDDCAAGTPLVEAPHGGRPPYVNWDIVGPNVMRQIQLWRKLRDMRIDTTEVSHGSTVWSDRLNVSPKIELPKGILVNP